MTNNRVRGGGFLVTADTPYAPTELRDERPGDPVRGGGFLVPRPVIAEEKGGD